MIIDTSNTIRKQGDFIARKLLLIEARLKECERLIKLYRCHCNDTLTFADFVEEAEDSNKLTFSNFINHG